MKKKINLNWYIKRLESVNRNHQALNNDETFKSIMDDLNKLNKDNVFRENKQITQYIKDYRINRYVRN